jgi:hypothetical protein
MASDDKHNKSLIFNWRGISIIKIGTQQDLKSTPDIIIEPDDLSKTDDKIMISFVEKIGRLITKRSSD